MLVTRPSPRIVLMSSHRKVGATDGRTIQGDGNRLESPGYRPGNTPGRRSGRAVFSICQTCDTACYTGANKMEPSERIMLVAWALSTLLMGLAASLISKRL